MSESTLAIQAQALLEYRKRQGISITTDATQIWKPSLKEFFMGLWPVLEPGRPYKDGWHIDAICDHLEAVTRNDIQNLIINIPPRHTKSLLVCVGWMTWSWIESPAMRWLFSSYSEKLSIRDSLKSRRVIQSAWYQANWGNLFQLTGDQNQKIRFENDQTGMRLATSVEGMATGEGGDVLVVDDPHRVDEAESDVVREGVLFWWDKVMSTRLNDPSTGHKVIVMQRVHENDLVGHLQEKMDVDVHADNYEMLVLPAEYEGDKFMTSIGFEDPRTEIGELLNPERFPGTSISGLKAALGEYGASGQLQQRPSPAGGGIFKRHWWKFWYPTKEKPSPWVTKMTDGTYVEHEQTPLPILDIIAQSWDCSFKETGGESYVAGQAWGKSRTFFFLLDQMLDRWDVVQTIEAVKRMTTVWPSSGLKLVEDKANGPAVIQTLRGQIPGMIAVNPMGDKESRARSVAPFAEAGNVYLPHPQLFPWVQKLIDTLAKFPKVKPDDEVDALTQMLIRWTKGLSPDTQPRNYMRTTGNSRGEHLHRIGFKLPGQVNDYDPMRSKEKGMYVRKRRSYGNGSTSRRFL